MTSRLWGRASGAGSFFDARHWLPTGVPVAGDSVGIEGGPVAAQGVLPSGVTINVYFLEAQTLAGSLLLQDATIGAGTVVNVRTEADTVDAVIPSALQVSGNLLNLGTLTFAGFSQNLSIPSGTTLTNAGTLNIAGTSTRFSAAAGASIVNNGLVRVINPTVTGYPTAVFGPAIGGSGAIDVSLNARVEFGGAVGAGQTLDFVGGAGASTVVQIDAASVFAGTVMGFVSGDTLTLANFAYTSAAYQSTGAASGVLQLYSGGGTPSASLQFQGVYAWVVSSWRRPRTARSASRPR